MRNFLMKWGTALFLAIFLLAGADAFARGGSSSSSRSSSSSSRSSSSSSSKSSSSTWGSKAASSSKPSSKSSTWGAKSNTAPAQKSTVWGSKTDNKPQSTRATMFSSESKARTQQAAYAKTTTATDWQAARAKYTASKPASYTPTYAPVQRPAAQQTIIVRTYNNSYGGYYYNDPYNHALIWGFSDLWWYNHWNSIDRSYYVNDPRYQAMEARVRALEAEKRERDENYKDPDMTEAVVYSDGYLNKMKSEPDEDNDSGGVGIFFAVLVGGMVVCIIGYAAYQAMTRRGY